MYPYILLSDNESKNVLGDLINVVYLCLKVHKLNDVVESKLPHNIFFYTKELSYESELFKNFPNLSKYIELVDYETYTFLKSNPEIKKLNYSDITDKNLYKLKNIKYLSINSVSNYSKAPLLEYPNVYSYILGSFSTEAAEDVKGIENTFNFDEDIFIDMTGETLYKSQFYINGIKDILDSKNEGIVCEIKCDGQCINSIKKKVKIHIFYDNFVTANFVGDNFVGDKIAKIDKIAKSSMIKKIEAGNFGDYSPEILIYKTPANMFYAFQHAKYMILNSSISFYGALLNKNSIESIIAISFAYRLLNNNFVGEKFIENFNIFEENIEIYKDKNFYYFDTLIRPEFLVYTDLGFLRN